MSVPSRVPPPSNLDPTPAREDGVRFVHGTPEAHAEAIRAILNEAIASSTALFDDKPRTLESMSAWFAKRASNFPVFRIDPIG